MRGARGATLVELLVATAIMLGITGAVMTLLYDGLSRTAILEDASDLHQRARITADAITADLRAAGNGTAAGPLGAVLPAAEPRWAGTPPGTATASAITIRYVPPLGARSRITQPLEPASGVAVVETAGCAQMTTACGFTTGMRALVFDATGQMDALLVDAIGPGTLVLDPSTPARVVTYPIGTEVAQIVEASYAVDATTRQLRRSEGGASLTIADNIDALTFEYRSDVLAQMPLLAFQDGPFMGSGIRAFDADLLNIRAIKVTLRVVGGDRRSAPTTASFTVALRSAR